MKINLICSLEPQFGHFLSVNVGDLEPPSVFSDIFRGQMATLLKIEEEDGTNENVHSQVFTAFFGCRLLN